MTMVGEKAPTIATSSLRKMTPRIAELATKYIKPNLNPVAPVPLNPVGGAAQPRVNPTPLGPTPTPGPAAGASQAGQIPSASPLAQLPEKGRLPSAAGYRIDPLGDGSVNGRPPAVASPNLNLQAPVPIMSASRSSAPAPAPQVDAFGRQLAQPSGLDKFQEYDRRVAASTPTFASESEAQQWLRSAEGFRPVETSESLASNRTAQLLDRYAAENDEFRRAEKEGRVVQQRGDDIRALHPLQLTYEKSVLADAGVANRSLLDAGYTPQQIAAMNREQYGEFLTNEIAQKYGSIATNLGRDVAGFAPGGGFGAATGATPDPNRTRIPEFDGPRAHEIQTAAQGTGFQDRERSVNAATAPGRLDMDRLLEEILAGGTQTTPQAPASTYDYQPAQLPTGGAPSLPGARPGAPSLNLNDPNLDPAIREALLNPRPLPDIPTTGASPLAGDVASRANALMAGGVLPGPGAPAADAAALRARVGEGVTGLLDSPVSVQEELAQRYAALTEGLDEDFQRGQTEIGRRTAALGRRGMGSVNTEFGDLELAREREKMRIARDLSIEGQAREEQMRLQRLGLGREYASDLATQDLAREGLGLDARTAELAAGTQLTGIGADLEGRRMGLTSEEARARADLTQRGEADRIAALLQARELGQRGEIAQGELGLRAEEIGSTRDIAELGARTDLQRSQIDAAVAAARDRASLEAERMGLDAAAARQHVDVEAQKERDRVQNLLQYYAIGEDSRNRELDRGLTREDFGVRRDIAQLGADSQQAVAQIHASAQAASDQVRLRAEQMGLDAQQANLAAQLAYNRESDRLDALFRQQEIDIGNQRYMTELGIRDRDYAYRLSRDAAEDERWRILMAQQAGGANSPAPAYAGDVDYYGNASRGAYDRAGQYY